MAPKPPSGNKTVATNRQARRDYEILDEWECGIMLQGSEVKSLREAKVTLTDAYARFEMRDLYLVGLHINAYTNASSQGGHELARTRKLLAHRHEIDEMRMRTQDLAEHRDVAGEDGRAEHQGLEGGDAEAFIQRQKEEELCLLVKPGQFRVADEARKSHSALSHRGAHRGRQFGSAS